MCWIGKTPTSSRNAPVLCAIAPPASLYQALHLMARDCRGVSLRWQAVPAVLAPRDSLQMPQEQGTVWRYCLPEAGVSAPANCSRVPQASLGKALLYACIYDSPPT